MKKLVITGGVIIVAVVAVVFFTLSNLGPIVKKTVNTVGPRITKTDVSVSDVDVSLFGGEAEIRNFFLGNPEGFSSGQAMRVASIYVDIDESSVTKDPIIINKIEIVAPEITYEKISGSDNFKALLNNVKGSAKSEKNADNQPDKAGEKRKKVIINNVIVKKGKVNLVMAVLGGKEITAPLPDIHLKDIGREKQGATPAQAFEKIFSSLYGSISADSVTRIFNDGLKQLGGLTELGTSGLDTGKKEIQKMIDTSSKDIQSAAEGLKSLFKKE